MQLFKEAADEVKRNRFYNSQEFKAEIARILIENKETKIGILLDQSFDNDTEESEVELREEPFGDPYKIIIGITELNENKTFIYKNNKGFIRLYLFQRPFLSFPYINLTIFLKDILNELPNTVKKITFKQIFFNNLNFYEDDLWKNNKDLFNNIPPSLEKINISNLKITNNNIYGKPNDVKIDEVNQLYEDCTNVFKSLWRLPYGTEINIKKIKVNIIN
jgi:hypothetical protein